MIRRESALDRERQRRVARLVSGRWNCELQPTGPYAHCDWFCRRGTEVVGIAELKVRTNAHQFYRTLYLSLNKALGLAVFDWFFDKPGVFVVAFTDGIYFTRVTTLDLDKLPIRVLGREDRAQAPNDREPIIEVPVQYLRRICDATGVFE